MGSTTGSGRFPGGGYGKPLQYSCLENPMDRGAWRGVVHSITRNQTRLKRLTVQTPALIYSTGLVPVGRFAANWLPRGEQQLDVAFILILRKGSPSPCPGSKMAPPSPAPAVCVQGTFIENALVIWGLEGPQLPVMSTVVSAPSRQARPHAWWCRAPLQRPRASLGPMQAAL